MRFVTCDSGVLFSTAFLQVDCISFFLDTQILQVPTLEVFFLNTHCLAGKWVKDGEWWIWRWEVTVAITPRQRRGCETWIYSLVTLSEDVNGRSPMKVAIWQKERFGWCKSLKDLKEATPLKINMEHNHGGLVQIIFLSKWVICRFHFNLPGFLLVHHPQNLANHYLWNIRDFPAMFDLRRLDTWRITWMILAEQKSWLTISSVAVCKIRLNMFELIPLDFGTWHDYRTMVKYATCLQFLTLGWIA